MAVLAFVDTETTGLDPDRHEVWELALILRRPDRTETEYVWQLPVDLGRAEAKALEIGRFYGRQNLGGPDDPWDVARRFAELTAGAHLVGAVPSFDDAFLKRFLRAHGACPGWHYHLVDVEALAIGWLAGRYHEHVAEGVEAPLLPPSPPWNSGDLTDCLGLVIDESTKHTALGDARWAKAIYDRVMP